MEQVILVDGADKELGLKEKKAAHLGSGTLHRAFSVFVINENGETLITKRSPEKMLWPLVWDNACASHPQRGESYQQAGQRRLKQELGFTCKLKYIDKFQYQAAYKGIGAENEICAILIGNYEGPVKPDPKEVVEYKWITIPELQKQFEADGEKYTPWLILALERLIEKGGIK